MKPISVHNKAPWTGHLNELPLVSQDVFMKPVHLVEMLAPLSQHFSALASIVRPTTTVRVDAGYAQISQ